jgi:tRNA pseudouridine55 synthase
MYSAIKHEGTPLYRLARAGVTVERASREVEVIRLDLLSWEPPVATLEIECSKGTYIRSIAHDLGAELGSGAILRDLVRVRCGPFHIEDAVSVSRLEETYRQGGIEAFLQPLEGVLGHIPAATVEDAETEADVRHGRPVDPARLPGAIPGEGGALCRAYSEGGRLLAGLRFDEDSGMWRPRKVLAPPGPVPDGGVADSR